MSLGKFIFMVAFWSRKLKSFSTLAIVLDYEGIVYKLSIKDMLW